LGSQLIGSWENLHFFPLVEGTSSADVMILPRDEQVWEMAYDVRPDLWGRGMGGEMIRCLVEVWVKWMGIGRVVAVSCRFFA